VGRGERLPRLKHALEFVVEANQTNMVVDTARAEAGDALQRIVVAPIDGTPRYRISIGLQPEAFRRVMHAVMNALEKSG
jgi:hypothetical protein